jgi:hypothetical protein
LINDSPLIPAHIDTLHKLEDYVTSAKANYEHDLRPEFWEAVDGRVKQFISSYTSRDDIELKLDVAE